MQRLLQTRQWRVSVSEMKKHAILLLMLCAAWASSCKREGSQLEAYVVPTPDVMVGTGCGDLQATELWVLNRETKQREFVLRGRGDADIEKIIADISDPVFSLDWKSIYFASAAWAVSGSIQKVDLKTKQVVFIIDGNSVDMIPRGKHKGMLLVDRALIKFGKAGESLGRDSYLWLVSANGKPLFEIGLSGGPEDIKFRAEHLRKTKG